MKVTIERLQSGKKLTTRERWYCFWRLFRLARKRDEEHPGTDQPCVDALRMLGYSTWVWRMVNPRDEKLLPKSAYPKFLRPRFLELEKKQRLYGMFGEHAEELLPKDQAVARMYANEHGREITPLEAAEERHKLFRKIKDHMREHGMFVHEGDGGDVHVLRLLRQCNKFREGLS